MELRACHDEYGEKGGKEGRMGEWEGMEVTHAGIWRNEGIYGPMKSPLPF